MKTKLETGKRYLFKTRFGALWSGTVREITPSGRGVLITNPLTDSTEWHESDSLEPIEELEDAAKKGEK